MDSLKAELNPTKQEPTKDIQDAADEKVAPPSGEETETREDKIMGASHALKTIFKLSIGPFFSQVTNSMYGFVNTIWLSKTAGPKAVAALSSTTTIDTLSTSFGYFLSTCASSRLAALFGDHKQHLASQVVTDLIRVCFICGILVPAVLLPASKPILRWFGASEDVVSLGFDYLVPYTSCAFFTCIYLLLCGCLQAEGRTLIFASAQVLAMVLNAGVFNPLFLLGFKTGIRGSSISIIVSQAIPALGILIPYYMGKFTIKPKPKELLNKFSPETFQALKTGVSSFIGSISATLPSMFFQKFIGASAGKDFNVMMSLYNAYNRVYQIAIALFLAFTLGFLPAASWAYAAKKKKRVAQLLFHVFWVITAICIPFQSFLFGAPKTFAKLFSSDELFIKRFKECEFPYWTTMPVCSWQYIATVLLQATDRATAAIVLSFITQICLWPALSFIFYYTNKHDVVRLFYAAMTNDLASFAISVPFVIVVLRDLLKKDDGVGEIIQPLKSSSAESLSLPQEESDSGNGFHETVEEL